MASNSYVSHFQQRGGIVPKVFAGKLLMDGYGYMHKGGNIGQVLGSLFRRVVPIIQRKVLPIAKKVAKRAGSELLRTGVNLVKDIAIDNKTPKAALRDNLQNLKRTAAQSLVSSMRQNSPQSTAQAISTAKRKRPNKKLPATNKRKKKKSTQSSHKDIFD